MRQKMDLFSLAAVLLCASEIWSADYSSWSYYRDITVNPGTAGGITTAESNYPLLIRLTTAGGGGAGSMDFTQAMANGEDVRFTASDLTTDLPYEIERWTGGAADLWVKVNSLSGGGNTVIRMYWGKAGSAAATSGATVFNSTGNNFRAVFHFNNSIGNSTNIALTPAATGTADITTTSVIGGHARNFNSAQSPNTSSFIDLGGATADAGLLNSTTPSTLGAWVYVTAFPNASGNYNTLIAHGAGDSREHFLRASTTSATATNWSFGLWNGATDFKSEFNFTNTQEVNNWHYIAGVYTGGTTGGTLTLYRDGIAVGPAVTVTGTLTNSTQNWALGRYGATNSARYFTGYMDEARIAGSARSASWIKWDFETQKAAQTCVTFGPAQITGPPRGLTYSSNPASYGVGAAIADNIPSFTSGGANTFTVAPALPAGLSLNAITGVITGTPTAASAATNYVVTASNSLGSVTATLNVRVVSPPTGLSYPASTYIFTRDQSITALVPTVTGTVTGYSITPVLTTGLSLNTTTGVISGTPTSVGAATYTVIASNVAGSASFTLTIVVNTPSGILSRNGSGAFVLRMGSGSLKFPAPPMTAALARISIMDMAGHTVWTQTTELGMNIRELSWNGITVGGRDASAGIYAVRMTLLDAQRKTIKILERKTAYAP